MRDLREMILEVCEDIKKDLRRLYELGDERIRKIVEDVEFKVFLIKLRVEK